MANIRRTALGRTIDMAALAAKNEKTRAVGNMKVNARGDTIDSTGKIVRTATAKVNEQYSKTVGNKSAHARRQTTVAAEGPRTNMRKPAQPVAKKEELSQVEMDLEKELEDDYEVEMIKNRESGNNG